MWRPMVKADLNTVLTIAAEVHIGFGEDCTLFANRLTLYPDGCWLAEDQGQMLGYSIAFPGLTTKPPKLNELWDQLPHAPDCLYWHDLCLRPAARGKKLGRRINDRMAVLTRQLGLHQMALISVHGSAPFWAAQGFVRQTPAPPSVVSYGPDAQFMVKEV